MSKTTKKIIIAALSTLVLFTSCNNETETTCYDGIKNGNETGIDCGGDCTPCSTATCFDGIQNGNETGIDCGGDCPDCDSCPTCFDGIQNGNETGIDCGGDCPPCPITFSLSGYIQKGPFITGTIVTVFELDSLFQNTGVTYNTNTFSNAGEYTLNNITTLSPYISLLATGNYFDEICNVQTNANLQLKGIAKISTDTTYNINILTHLSYDRILYLTEHNFSFDEAKAIAQSEVLDIFEIENYNDAISFDQLNINNNSEEDAILLAISTIIQGYKSTSEVTSFLNDLSNDLKTDGEINDENLGAELLAHAKAIDINSVISNLESRYESIGISTNTPDFEGLLENFINNTDFPDNASIIEFPENGAHGVNILNLNTTEYSQANPTVTGVEDYSIHAVLPNDCLTLKVKISKVSAQCMDACWYYEAPSVQNWIIDTYAQGTHSQEFVTNGESCDAHFIFNGIGTFRIDYFINGSNSPTHSKEIIVN